MERRSVQRAAAPESLLAATPRGRVSRSQFLLKPRPYQGHQVQLVARSSPAVLRNFAQG